MLKPTGKRKYQRSSTMSEAEVMLIMILFHESCCRCFKHFYLEKVCEHLRYLFPKKPCNKVQRTIDTQLALRRIRQTRIV